MFFPVGRGYFRCPFEVLATVSRQSSLICLPGSVITSGQQVGTLSGLRCEFIITGDVVYSSDSSV